MEEEVFLGEFQAEIRKTVRNIAHVAGLRDLLSFPYDRLKREEAWEGREESSRSRGKRKRGQTLVEMQERREKLRALVDERSKQQLDSFAAK